MHDFFEDHVHLAGKDPNLLLEEIEGVEKFVLTSVGIDIGSSTTHLIFSQLTLRREGSLFSARFKVADRKILYRSRIILTPYINKSLIDVERLKKFFEETYAEAGFTPEDIDTGAVIITGEALKKENAKPIVDYFSRYSGKFICAAAGHNHEALLSAYGSGAVDLSKTEHKTVLNIDIGGGTSKFALIENGTVRETSAINIGARLIAFDRSDVIVRIEEPGKELLEYLGYRVEINEKITEKQKQDLASLMAKILIELIEANPKSYLTKKLMLTPFLSTYRGLEDVDYVVVSGGVSEHVYGYDQSDYGDVGPYLGRYIRKYLSNLGAETILREPLEGIRATVIGAGGHTVQTSGSTCYISSSSALPAYGLKVVKVPLIRKSPAIEALRMSLSKFDLTSIGSDIALSLTFEGELNYPFLREVAEAIAYYCPNQNFENVPLYLIQEVDIAKSIGSILKEEILLNRNVIALDGIDVGDLDFIDIGRPIGRTEVIPVTIKSLLFLEPKFALKGD